MFIQRVLTAAFVMLPFASQAQNDAVFNYGFDPHMGYREIRLPDRNDGVILDCSTHLRVAKPYRSGPLGVGTIDPPRVRGGSNS